MDLQIVERGAITLIGKEGRGPAATGGQWVPPLWQMLQSQAEEIAHLVLRQDNGTIAGTWGAMSDVTRRFLPWDDEGLYLAACEAVEGIRAPEGWQVWTLPPMRYLLADCTPQTYGAVFQKTIFHTLPENGYTLSGAVQEFYPPQGGMTLYIPIARL